MTSMAETSPGKPGHDVGVARYERNMREPREVDRAGRSGLSYLVTSGRSTAVPMTRDQSVRTGALFMTFRTRTAHIVQFRPIGIEIAFFNSRQNSTASSRPVPERSLSAASLDDGRKTETSARVMAMIPFWSVFRRLTPVDYDRGPRCETADCQSSTVRSVKPRVPRSSATS